jgi:hypothetical protein
MLVRAFNAAKALVKRFSASPALAPQGSYEYLSEAEVKKRFAPTTKLPRANKYATSTYDGAWPAARRVRAMVRSAHPIPTRAVFNTMHGERTVLSMYAVREEYERHVRNGNVYK